MSTPALTRIAATAAAFMLAHQVAGKALRDAAFFASWDPASLPLMVLATATLVVAAVPMFARLLERYGPRPVVAVGFILSAAAHVVESRASAAHPWVAVAIYLHVAGLGALLLSGFWSLVSERFDPRGARRSFGRIAAGGTIGGLLGGVAAERMAVVWTIDGALLVLAGLHVICAAIVQQIGRAPVLLPSPDEVPSARLVPVQELRTSPHLRTIALIVLFSTAAAGVLDFLVKWLVTQEIGTGPELFRFFAIFYGAIQIASFLAQTASGRALHRLGVGRTISTLPAGVGLGSAVSLVFPVLPMVVVARGIEAVLRSSLFRSAYELLFVPMDSAERRRMKTFLDVTCDRAGEAMGALIVQAMLLTSAVFLAGQLLIAAIVLAAATLWLGRRLDRLYLGVVEQQLARHVDQVSVVVGSDVSWTMLDLGRPLGVSHAGAPSLAPPRAPSRTPPRQEDARLRLLGELRSGDRARVEAALRRLTRPDRAQVAQVIELLAWDDVVASARAVLERAADANVGLLADALLDADTDFAIRRRIPRILGMVPAQRALDALCPGLDDARFEVRYQCGRAIDRLLRKADRPLVINRERMLSVIERELSLPPSVWQGLRLIDGLEQEADADEESAASEAQRNLEHVFTLLGTVLPRDAVRVAFRGLQSSNPGLRGLAVEYLEGVLPPALAEKLWHAIEAPVEPRAERLDPARALEELRRSTGTPIISPRAVRPSGDDAP